MLLSGRWCSSGGWATGRPLLVTLVATSFIVWVGCSPRTRSVILPDARPFAAITESRTSLLARVAGLQADISVLVATELEYTATVLGQETGEQSGWEDIEGSLRVDRPDDIRMRGSYGIVLNSVTLFDMVSDGEAFRVSLPTQDQFITGAAESVVCTDNPLHNLRPQHIMEALFVDISPYMDDPEIVNTLEQATEDRRSFYVLNFNNVGGVPAQLVEKIWIDRRDLSIFRRQLFGEEGVLEADVSYSEWEELDGGWFPRQLVVERPLEDYRLEIQFNELRLNFDPPSEQAFLLNRPVGSELLTVESVGATCADVAESN